MDKIVTQNVILSSQNFFDGHLDLQILFEALKGKEEVKYTPTKFPGLTLKLFNHGKKISILVFKSNKIIIGGLKDLNQIDEVCALLKKVLQKYDVKINPRAIFIINNIVVSFQWPTEILLPKLLEENPDEDMSYDSESFPGLIYRVQEEGPVRLLFYTGKCVITGAKSLDSRLHAINKIKSFLKK
jgi:transcription initiation factor TFIID TATA-box-binding protein